MRKPAKPAKIATGVLWCLWVFSVAATVFETIVGAVGDPNGFLIAKFASLSAVAIWLLWRLVIWADDRGDREREFAQWDADIDANIKRIRESAEPSQGASKSTAKAA